MMADCENGIHAYDSEGICPDCDEIVDRSELIAQLVEVTAQVGRHRQTAECREADIRRLTAERDGLQAQWDQLALSHV